MYVCIIITFKFTMLLHKISEMTLGVHVLGLFGCRFSGDTFILTISLSLEKPTATQAFMDASK